MRESLGFLWVLVWCGLVWCGLVCRCLFCCLRVRFEIIPPFPIVQWCGEDDGFGLIFGVCGEWDGEWDGEEERGRGRGRERCSVVWYV